MKIIFLTSLILISLFFYIAYSMFVIYGLKQSVVNNSTPVKVYCPVCPEKICPICEPCGFGYCNYDAVCNELYCEACPKTFEEELKACQDLLLLEREN